MKKTTQKAIKAAAVIDTADVSAPYFPYPEPTTKELYSAGVNGCNGFARRGEISGELYATTGRNSALFANDRGGCNVAHMGARELAIVEYLASVEEIETIPDGYAVIRFTDIRGNYFDVVSRDAGHTWTICG